MREPEFWRRDDLISRLARGALAPASALYGVSVAWKVRHATPYRSEAKVISAGNLTAGGSGKTPVAIAIARLLLARGARVAFLTRGYGGREKGPVRVDLNEHTAAQVGDEPLLLAAAAPTIVARNRAEGAKLADLAGADIIVMDDGHQNFSLAKDLSLAVVDAQTWFGNGLVLPAGPLREPVAQGLLRADAVILIGDGEPALDDFGGLVLRADLVTQNAASYAHERVIAFAGIGRPEKFFDSLRASGAKILAAREFPDHHPYRQAEIDALKQDAGQSNALLVTTEKDLARLTPQQRAGIAALKVSAEFRDEGAIGRLLGRVWPAG